jgi:hypothetical protein
LLLLLGGDIIVEDDAVDADVGGGVQEAQAPPAVLYLYVVVKLRPAAGDRQAQAADISAAPYALVELHPAANRLDLGKNWLVSRFLL